MKASELIRAAVEHLDRVGWHQGSFFKDHEVPYQQSPCCGLGALRVQCGWYSAASVKSVHEYYIARDALNAVVYRDWVTYQDAPGRRWTEVRAKMLEAATKAEWWETK